MKLISKNLNIYKCQLYLIPDTEIESWKEKQMKYLEENNLTFHEEKILENYKI